MLAALADAAVPGLRPIEVEGQPVRSGAPYQCVDVTGEDGKRWTVRASLTTAAGAAVDSSSALARLLRPRLEVALPEVAGVARTSDDSIVAVYPQLPGQALSFRDLQARSPLARSLGTVIAGFLPALTTDVQGIIDDTKTSVLWFEALFNQKANTDASNNAAPLLTGNMSAQDYMSKLQADLDSK